MKRSSEKNSEKLNKRKRVISAIMVFFMLLVSFTPAGYSIFADESTISQIASTEAENRTNPVSDESGLDTSVPGDAVTNEASLEHLTLELTQEESDEEGTLQSRVVSEKETLEAQEEVEETSIVLDGMMPKNATATAVDVTVEREKIEAADAEAAAKKNESEKNASQQGNNGEAVSPAGQNVNGEVAAPTEQNAVSDASSEVEQSITGNSTSEQNKNSADDTAVTNQSNSDGNASENQTSVTESGESDNRNEADDVSVNPVQDTVYKSADVQPVDGSVEYANASQGDAEMREADGTRNDSADGSTGNEAGQNGSADNTNDASVSGTTEAGNNADQSGIDNRGDDSTNSSTKDASNNGKSQKANEEDDEREIISVLSDGLSILAAYDITILDAGDEEYQPSEKHPITVSIRDARIKEDSKLYLWHIKDDGEKEEIKEFTVADGELRFDAVGFSIYEIVAGPSPSGVEWKKVGSLADIRKYGEKGFYICNQSKYYLKGGLIHNVSNNSDRDGLAAESTAKNPVPDTAVKYYFEPVSNSNDSFYVYELIDGVKNYVLLTPVSGNTARGGLTYSTTDRTAFTLENSSKGFYASAQIEGRTDIYYWNRNTNNTNSAAVGAIAAYNVKGDTNTFMLNLFYRETDDQFGLAGKSYGLMYSNGENTGNALVAEEPNYHSLTTLPVRTSASGQNVLYVDENNDISMWRFNFISDDLYKLSTTVNGTTKYLKVESSGISFVDSVDDASMIKVTPLSGTDAGKISLSVDDMYICFDSTSSGFGVSTDGTATGCKLNLVKTSQDFGADNMVYSAREVSVSDLVNVPNGAKVIVYTRVWYEDLENNIKEYRFYAIDKDGSLKECYERGDNIMWLGNAMNTLEWDFTEYYWEGTTDPNFYYELYNPSSGLYLAPQVDGTVLSDEKVGINLNGRRHNEYYTDIVAWDERYRNYAGLRPNEGATAVESCALPKADTFYFAIMNPVIKEDDQLETIETVDNNAFGIEMKLVNHSYVNSGTGAADSVVTQNIMGKDYGDTKGLLTTNIDPNTGYPKVKKNGNDLGGAFSGEFDVNHLFSQSVYDESGYFEFNSCQNFATIIGADGSVSDTFTVYRQLGTTDATDTKPTLKHGQFFPFNTIVPGKFSPKNPENLYSVFANWQNASVGKLPTSDPRYGEKLYTIEHDGQKPDYYLGMEMSAKFVQTPNGLDSWGHDMIFEFTGDDDFWLYVDDELVLDLGGIHSAQGGWVNFKTGEVYYKITTTKANQSEDLNNDGYVEKWTTLYDVFYNNYISRGMSAAEATAAVEDIFITNKDGDKVFENYSKHKMKLFYMERGAGASNLHLRFNLSSVTPGNVLLAKKLSGKDAKHIDFDLARYPFQIWYRLGDGTEHLLDPNDPLVKVKYQNTEKNVDFSYDYVPPGFSTSKVVHNVFFLTAERNVEVKFPDGTIEYCLCEVAVNNDVYDEISINGNPVGEVTWIPLPTDIKGYATSWDTVENTSNVTFDNHVKDGAIRTLEIKKLLHDAEGNELTSVYDPDHPETYDPTEFAYRLSFYSKSSGKYELANRYKYYVGDPNGKLCKWDPTQQKYVPTDYNVEGLDVTTLPENVYDSIMCYTSIYGKIDHIPADYIVYVPGLPVDSKFMVEERDDEVPPGYKLDRYDWVEGSYILDEQGVINKGIVRANNTPRMMVVNERGYGITENKEWTDEDFSEGYDPIYIALYENDTLVEGSVREIKYPDKTSYYYYMQDISNMVTREVTLGNPNPTVEEGVVTDTGTVTPVLEGGRITIRNTAGGAITPLEYTVDYEEGTLEGVAQNVRTDTITNIRPGGVAIRLFKWDGTDPQAEDPLAGGKFTLTCDGVEVGKYTSDEKGKIVILYDEFDPAKEYVLTQTASPNGYTGLSSPISFRIYKDATDPNPVIILTNPNGPGWAKTSEGANGILGYVDVYNKPYTLKVLKQNDTDPFRALPGARFSLYKQVYTSIGGYSKAAAPMTEYWDVVTGADGTITIVSVDDKKTLKPGTYYLTETAAPLNYQGVSGDIVFSISDLGVVNLISLPDETMCSFETEDNEADKVFENRFIVKNTKTGNNAELTITKTVVGNQGNKAKDFSFTFSVTNDPGTTIEYEWSKNGYVQTTALKSGQTFTMRHDDVVVISIPVNAEVTISENNEDYKPSFKLGTADADNVNTKTFTVSTDTTLAVTNTRDGIIPTGIWISFKTLAVLGAACLAGMFYFWRRKRKTEKFLAKVRSGE